MSKGEGETVLKMAAHGLLLQKSYDNRKHQCSTLRRTTCRYAPTTLDALLPHTCAPSCESATQ